MSLLPLAALLLAALPPQELESKAARHVALEYERVGRQTPVRDPALDAAARSLAKEAVASSAADAADMLTLAEALSIANAHDPGPRALIVRGSPRDEPLKSFLTRQDF